VEKFNPDRRDKIALSRALKKTDVKTGTAKWRR
jgi:hypothetical protein